MNGRHDEPGVNKTGGRFRAEERRSLACFCGGAPLNANVSPHLRAKAWSAALEHYKRKLGLQFSSA
jgi:hypothetical protein